MNGINPPPPLIYHQRSYRIVVGAGAKAATPSSRDGSTRILRVSSRPSHGFVWRSHVTSQDLNVLVWNQG